MLKRLLKICLILLFCLVLASCAAGTSEYIDNPAGFFSGVWHGWIAPFSIAWHFLFDPEVRIYETRNDGIWYDVGFYFAVISGFGSLSLTRSKKKRKKK